MSQSHRDVSDASPSDRRRAQGLHDATCQGQNGPCWCQEEPEEEIYPVRTECVECGLAFGSTRPDGSKVTEAQYDDRWICARCAPCRNDCSCDSEEEHERAVEESMRDFLRNPGEPPPSMDEEQVERARIAIARARREAGL